MRALKFTHTCVEGLRLAVRGGAGGEVGPCAAEVEGLDVRVRGEHRLLAHRENGWLLELYREHGVTSSEHRLLAHKQSRAQAL